MSDTSRCVRPKSQIYPTNPDMSDRIATSRKRLRVLTHNDFDRSRSRSCHISRPKSRSETINHFWQVKVKSRSRSGSKVIKYIFGIFRLKSRYGGHKVYFLSYLGQGQGQGQKPRSPNTFGDRSMTHTRPKYPTIVHY